MYIEDKEKRQGIKERTKQMSTQINLIMFLYEACEKSAEGFQTEIQCNG